MWDETHMLRDRESLRGFGHGLCTSLNSEQVGVEVRGWCESVGIGTDLAGQAAAIAEDFCREPSQHAGLVLFAGNGDRHWIPTPAERVAEMRDHRALWLELLS